MSTVKHVVYFGINKCMATTLTYKGFSSYSASGTLYDMELAKADLMNHFMTRKGERVMAPEFGSIIWDVLFDPLTPELIQLINEDVLTIIKSDPRFRLQDINVSEIESGLILSVDVYYYPKDIIDTLTITFDKNAQEIK